MSDSHRCRRPGCRFQRKPRTGRHAGKYYPTCGGPCRWAERASEGLLAKRYVRGRDLAADATEMVRLIDVLDAREQEDTPIGDEDVASLMTLDRAYRIRNHENT